MQRGCLVVASLSFCLQACGGTSTFYADTSLRPGESVSDPPRAIGVIDPREVHQRILLIGDAGEPESSEPTLHSVRRFLQHERQVRTAAVFLGDNVYPKGPVEKGNRGAQALARQLNATAMANPVVFLPGNHDWDDALCFDFKRGLAKLESEQAFLSDLDEGERVRPLPQAGCPGPVEVDGLAGVRLIVLDSEWLLLRDSRKEDEARRRSCAATNNEEVYEKLRDLVACTEHPCLPVVVAAHHPLETQGEHGGSFAWHSYLLAEGFVPPPFSLLYVWYRRAGGSPQDHSSSEYQDFVGEVHKALADGPRPIYAAGHEHALQIFRGRYTSFSVVSGSAAKRGPVSNGDGTLFAHGWNGLWSQGSCAGHGWMALDFLHAGRAVLRVFSACQREPLVAMYLW